MPDIQAQPDERGLVVDRAGIRGLRLPAGVTDIDGARVQTVAAFDVSARVRSGRRGTHMSRLVQVAHELAPNLRLAELDAALDVLATRMQERGVSLSVRFPWFIAKHAPVSGMPSLLDIEVEILARTRAITRKNYVEMTVHVPVTSLCPCSKAISRYGAHNQRSIVSVRIEARPAAAIARIVDIVERNGSCPVYATLKREDERAVTELAYENPKFAEDIVRDVYSQLRRDLRPQRLRVATENHESIHNHAAYAELGDLDWKR